MTNEPLGLPEGSVRAILALVIVVATVVAMFLGKTGAAGPLSSVAGAVIGFYFGNRTANSKGGHS